VTSKGRSPGRKGRGTAKDAFTPTETNDGWQSRGMKKKKVVGVGGKAGIRYKSDGGGGKLLDTKFSLRPK